MYVIFKFSNPVVVPRRATLSRPDVLPPQRPPPFTDGRVEVHAQQTTISRACWVYIIYIYIYSYIHISTTSHFSSFRIIPSPRPTSTPTSSFPTFNHSSAAAVGPGPITNLPFRSSGNHDDHRRRHCRHRQYACTHKSYTGCHRVLTSQCPDFNGRISGINSNYVVMMPKT